MHRHRSSNVLLLLLLLIIISGDLNERIRVLKSANLTSLAYVTAATHALTEEADELRDIVTEGDKQLPDLLENAVFLKPPPPVQQAEANWPLLTISRVRNRAYSI